MYFYNKTLIGYTYFLKESSKNFYNAHFLEHKEKFKPVLDEISQLDISYSNSLKYDKEFEYK